MKKIYLFVIVSLTISSCNNINKPATATQYTNEVKVQHDNVSAAEQDLGSFEDFLDRFNRDSVFQKSRIIFPLKAIFSMDETEENSDSTFYIEANDFMYIQLTEPSSNFMPGRTFITIKGTGSKRTVIFTLEDTGVHIEYYFRQKNKKWMMESFYDLST